MSAWWYPKNLLIFRANEERDLSDLALVAHPKQADMLSPSYLNIGGPGEFATMWKKDWKTFGRLFYKAQKAARKRERRRAKQDTEEAVVGDEERQML